MAFITKITTRNHELRTTSIETDTWNEVANIIMNQSTSPTLYEVSVVDGDFLLYLMVDHTNAHLSLWRGDTCYYASEGDADDFVDIGWNSFPAWCVVKNSSKILEAAEKFINEDQLVTEFTWKSETLEL